MRILILKQRLIVYGLISRAHSPENVIYCTYPEGPRMFGLGKGMFGLGRISIQVSIKRLICYKTNLGLESASKIVRVPNQIFIEFLMMVKNDQLVKLYMGRVGYF